MVLSERRSFPMSVFPTRILLATDGSPEAELANVTAVDLANSTNSELHVVTVARNPEPAYLTEAGSALNYEQLMQSVRQRAQDTLDGEVRRIEDSGGKVEKAHLRIGESRDQEIVTLSEEQEIGLIVIGSRGLGGMRRALMGSVSDSVVPEHWWAPGYRG
jgi:nucleotide-binding universal stress UspA family protein